MPSSQHVFSIKLNSPWPMPKSRDIARPYHLLFSTKLFLNNNRQQVLTFMKGYGFKDSCSQQICSCRKPPADGFSCPEFLEWHADLGPSKPTDPGFNNHYEQPLPLATASLKTHILKSYPRFSGGVVVWMMSWTYKSQVTLIAKVIMCGPWFSAIFGGDSKHTCVEVTSQEDRRPARDKVLDKASFGRGSKRNWSSGNRMKSGLSVIISLYGDQTFSILFSRNITGKVLATANLTYPWGCRIRRVKTSCTNLLLSPENV